MTARGWEDLAKVISLYEQMGKPVNRDLFVQFLRDDDIADQFTVYYSLFEKYRSDYQVGSILSGTATLSIKDRAKAAPFDERIALLGLMIDTLSADCSKALDQEGIVVTLRDLLRETKPSSSQVGASTRRLPLACPNANASGEKDRIWHRLAEVHSRGALGHRFAERFCSAVHAREGDRGRCCVSRYRARVQS